MPMCGFNPQMLKGLTQFAQGLYVSVLRLSRERGISVEQAMEIELHEMNVFLAALDEHYEDLRRSQSVDDAMRGLVRWVDDYVPASNYRAGATPHPGEPAPAESASGD